VPEFIDHMENHISPIPIQLIGLPLKKTKKNQAFVSDQDFDHILHIMPRVFEYFSYPKRMNKLC
jgi:hypothetical protein